MTPGQASLALLCALSISGFFAGLVLIFVIASRRGYVQPSPIREDTGEYDDGR